MGFWSTYSTRVIRLRSPERPLKVPGRSPVSLMRRCSAGYRMSPTRELFPLPLTPLTTVKAFSGKVTSISFRLFCMAPFTVIPYCQGFFVRAYG